MKSRYAFCAALLGATFFAGPVLADYDSHPEIRPENRCGMIPAGIGDPKDPGGIHSLHCQRLFWDLPATTRVGALRVGAPFAEDPIPRFPNGVTDRIPPMYMLDANGDGVSDNGQGYEKPGAGRVRLCSDVDDIPFWEPLLNADGSGKVGTDELGNHSVADPSKAQTGPLFKLACRRGSRTYYGPWQTGTDPAVFDRLVPDQAVRFDNTGRLNRDVDVRHVTDEQHRVEWNVGTEIYNHFASHHGTCYNAATAPCSNPKATQPRGAFQPGGACWDYQKDANGPGDPQGKGRCDAADENPACSGKPPTQAFRNATQLPGRLALDLPGGRGIQGVEDQIWGCNHHVVTQLPPGSYGMTRLANYRLQKGGITSTVNYPNWGLKAGQVIGGSVGEMVFQYFTEPANAPVKPVNIVFNVIGDVGTTVYPPFTWNYHESLWYPPYDASVGLMTIHSHHRMVKGTMNLEGGHVPRLNSPDPLCGGMKSGATPTDLYTDWTWEDAPVCEYWRDPDGPVTIRKGQALRTTCFVNNGVTPEAIKHGLVGGSTVEMLRNLGAPIPQQPAAVPASTWGDLLAGSPVGEQFLYGTHPTNNYRVRYACGPAPAASAPIPLSGGKGCDPNAHVDGDGDYVDGPYQNTAQCGANGWCNPSTIVFACVGEDEMCIGVAMYWALPRLGNPETNDEAVKNLQNGDVDNVGTPGSAIQTDIVNGGICHDCKPGL
jgi:hypothetical protein